MCGIIHPTIQYGLKGVESDPAGNAFFAHPERKLHGLRGLSGEIFRRARPEEPEWKGRLRPEYISRTDPPSKGSKRGAKRLRVQAGWYRENRSRPYKFSFVGTFFYGDSRRIRPGTANRRAQAGWYRVLIFCASLCVRIGTHGTRFFMRRGVHGENCSMWNSRIF